MSNKDRWVIAAAFSVIALLIIIVIVLTHSSAPAKPSHSDIIACEIDKAGGFHPDPCPTDN
jgi:hypothetical protein